VDIGLEGKLRHQPGQDRVPLGLGCRFGGEGCEVEPDRGISACRFTGRQRRDNDDQEQWEGAHRSLLGCSPLLSEYSVIGRIHAQFVSVEWNGTNREQTAVSERPGGTRWGGIVLSTADKPDVHKVENVRFRDAIRADHQALGAAQPERPLAAPRRGKEPDR